MKNFCKMTIILIFSILAVRCSCHCPKLVTEAPPPAAMQPPAGLLAEQVPQFVVFGSDDNGNSGLEGSGAGGGLHFLTRLFAGQRNPAGSGNSLTFDASPLHYSFYVNTYYIDAAPLEKSAYASERENPVYIKRAWKEALDSGHEIGVHTHSHAHGREFSQQQWREEMQRCIDILGRPYDAAESPKGTAASQPAQSPKGTAASQPARSPDNPDRESGLGVGRERLAGFRTPFLEYNDDTLKAAQQLGFLYDCSLEEGTQPDQDGSNFLWPYRLDQGSPGNTPLIGPHPGLWEVPVYVFMVPPDEACSRYGVAPGLRSVMQQRQNYFDPAAGKITGMDWNLWCEYATTPAEFSAILKYTLDQRLNGNRCPLTIGLHSELYSDKQDTKGLNATVDERRAALSEFFAYVLQLPQVRVVDYKELLDWLQRPVPLPVTKDPQ